MNGIFFPNRPGNTDKNILPRMQQIKTHNQ